MKRYAEGTEVTVDRSRVEIDRLLQRYGATSFMYGSNQSSAMVAFEIKGRRVKFILPMPDRNSEAFTHVRANSSGFKRELTATQAFAKFEQATRESWRALALCIKAKLESVEAKIETFDEAFLPHIVMQDGRTVGEVLIPDLSKALNISKLPPLLASGKS